MAKQDRITGQERAKHRWQRRGAIRRAPGGGGRARVR